MVRVNGKESAALLTNMYPDAVIGREVLHLPIDAPDGESALWETGVLSTSRRIGGRSWERSCMRPNRE